MRDLRAAVGIDVSKDTLAVAIRPGRGVTTLPNTPAGWADLGTRLDPLGQPCIVLEATGGYERGLVAALATAGHPAAVINPARTHAFIASEGQQTKTDHTDAELLARFAAQKQPAPTPVATTAQRQLAELVACRTDLVGLRVAAKNRRQQATAVTHAHHDAVIAALTTQIAQVEVEIAAVIATDPELARRNALLQSAPGIGPVLAAVLLATLPELGTGPAKGLASLAGVAPHTQQSGKDAGHAHLQGGRPAVRQALFQMAITATRGDRGTPMQVHAHQLRARGKAPKVVTIACARRMLGILHAMIRDALRWDETKVGQGHFLPVTEGA
jgi:transposase